MSKHRLNLTGDITLEENAFLIGCVLGDGFIQRTPSQSGACRLRIEHSIKQKEYVDWKRNRLLRFCETTQSPKEVLLQKGYQTYLFYTSYRQDLASYHSFFYTQCEKRYVKRLTPELEDMFTDSLSLAVWFLDDGTMRLDCSAGRIATQSFPLEENFLFQRCLERDFSVVTKIEASKGRNGPLYGLSVPAKSFSILRDSIYDLVRNEIPSMLYKLDRPRND